MVFPSYHLWLKPSDGMYHSLAETIDELAQRLGCPAFPPHVTLLGSMAGTERELCERTEALARRLQPFEVILTEPRVGSKYFECVFISVRPAGPVMDANALAKRVFDRADEAYRPHLSMVYGELPDEQKYGVLPRLSAFPEQSFQADRLYLIKACSFDPKDWYEISSASLGARAP